MKRMAFVGILSIIFGLLASCASPANPTSTSVIGKEKAIQLAIEGCRHPHVVLVGEPTNTRAKLMTLEEADKSTRGEGETSFYMQSMDTKVWFIEMDGQLQLIGGPQPPVRTIDNQPVTPTQSQPASGTCISVIDATSGDLIFVRDTWK